LDIGSTDAGKGWNYDNLPGFQSKDEIRAAFDAAGSHFGKGKLTKILKGLAPHKSRSGKMFIDMILNEGQQGSFRKLLDLVVPDMVDPETGEQVTRGDVEDRVDEFLKGRNPIEVKSGKIESAMVSTQVATRKGFKGIMLGDTSEPGAVEEAWENGWVLVHYKPTQEMLKNMSMSSIKQMNAGVNPDMLSKAYGGDFKSLEMLEKIINKLDAMAGNIDSVTKGKMLETPDSSPTDGVDETEGDTKDEEG